MARQCNCGYVAATRTARDVAVRAREPLEATTRQARRDPASRGRMRYVRPRAAGIGCAFRSQPYAYRIGGAPLQCPRRRVSVAPTRGRPRIDGRTRLATVGTATSMRAPALLVPPAASACVTEIS